VRGTECDPAFRHRDGDARPRGSGYIGFAVPDLDAAVRRFDDDGVERVERPERGRARDVASVGDPDGRRSGIVEPGRPEALGRRRATRAAASDAPAAAARGSPRVGQ